MSRQTYAFDVVPVSTSAIPVTAANLVDTSTDPAMDCTQVSVYVDLAAIRFTVAPGSTPTAGGDGVLVNAGSLFTIDGTHDVGNLLMIADTATDAACQVHYLKGASII